MNTNEGFVKPQYLGPHRLAYGGRVIIHTHLIEWSQNRGASKLLTAFDFYGNGGEVDAHARTLALKADVFKQMVSILRAVTDVSVSQYRWIDRWKNVKCITSLFLSGVDR